MSAKAITARLKRIEQLRRLCLSLGKATFPTMDKKEAGSKKQLNGKEGDHRK
jgi:hypothetical protein